MSAGSAAPSAEAAAAAAVAAAAGEQERVLCTSFNQDHSYFTVGTTRGFRVYAADPFRFRFGKGLSMGPFPLLFPRMCVNVCTSRG